MRNKRIMGGIAATAALVVGIAGVAIGAPAVQTIDAEVGGKTTPKLDKKKFKKSSIDVTTTTSDQANPAGIPPKATEAKITFDKKNLKFDTKAAPTCDPNEIENTTTENALAACGDAVVGTGSGIAALPLGPGGTRANFNAVVTAFNRADAKGILLHSRVGAPLNTTVVLKGTIKGTTLTVDVPPIGAGVGAIAEFNTKVKKGKYVQARCTNKKIKTTSTFTFSDAPPADATDTQKCKQKK
jgi:hypothetical protein